MSINHWHRLGIMSITLAVAVWIALFKTKELDELDNLWTILVCKFAILMLILDGASDVLFDMFELFPLD